MIENQRDFVARGRIHRFTDGATYAFGNGNTLCCSQSARKDCGYGCGPKEGYDCGDGAGCSGCGSVCGNGYGTSDDYFFQEQLA